MTNSFLKGLSVTIFCSLLILTSSCMKDSVKDRANRKPVYVISDLDREYDNETGLAVYRDKEIMRIYGGPDSFICATLSKVDRLPGSIFLGFIIVSKYSSNNRCPYTENFIFDIEGENVYYPIKPEIGEITTDNNIPPMVEIFMRNQIGESPYLTQLIWKIINSRKTILRCIGNRTVEREITDLEKASLWNVMKHYEEAIKNR